VFRNSADANGAILNLGKGRGTVEGTYSLISTDDILGIISAYGADGTSTLLTGASIRAIAKGTPASNDIRAQLEFRTGSGTGGTQSTALACDINQAVLAPSPTGGIGYGTGAGGTVTQATSKSTGVTLNKVSGQITTNNANLGANAVVTFVVTNSTVTATDVPIVGIQSPSGGKYRAYVSAVSAGSFEIMLVNATGGPLAESVIINFGIIRAVTA
jgi:hypothetical protein